MMLGKHHYLSMQLVVRSSGSRMHIDGGDA
jgi:hypothetical protein